MHDKAVATLTPPHQSWLQSSKKRIAMAAVSVLLLVMVAELAFSIRWQSLTWDEGDHLFAGYMSLKAHDYSLNPEHPPMAKMVAALPLLPLDLKIPPQQGRYFKEEAYFGGREMLFRNGPANGGKYSADTLIFRARMAVSVFVLMLALLVFLAGSEMFGLGAGLIAMTLFVFDPSVLTNGAYVTTDATVSCMFFATIYAFYRYVKRPSALRLLITGIAAGMALAAKHSAILLLPMLVLLALGELIAQWRNRRASQENTAPFSRNILHIAGALTAIILIAVAVLWAFYDFRYHMRPDGSPMSPTLASTAAFIKPLEARGILLFAKLHLLPESYLFGLVDVRRVAGFMPTYIFGKVYAHGVWFYFPVVLALKWTIGAMLLLALAIWAAASGKLKHAREVFFLVVPPIVYLAVAISSPLDIGVRHILPTFAFLFTLAARGAWALIRSNRRWIYAVAPLLLWHAVSSARVFPNYMPYANELWGGPAETHRYLTDSATDWGQQLKATMAYLDAHNVKQCWFAYFVAPFVLPSDYGIPCKPLPTFDTLYEEDLDIPATINGPVLISYADLNGFEFGTSVRNPYQSFFLRQPDAVIANGIAVYNGAFDVPLASALQYVRKAERLLNTDPQAALSQATQAVAIAPNDFDPQLALADVLRKLGRKSEAADHYQRALETTKRMEPSAQKYWVPRVQERLKSVV